MKGVDENVLCWLGNTERMENDMSAKMVYMGVCVGNWLVGQLRKKRTDSGNDYLKRGLIVVQARGLCIIGINDGSSIRVNPTLMR